MTYILTLITALLAAAIICAVEGVDVTIVLILAIAAVVLAFLHEQGILARRAPAP